MNLNINVEDYLDESEIKQICKDAVRDSFLSKIKDEQDLKRVLSNNAYEYIHQKVDAIIPNYQDVISENISQLVNKKDMYKFLVFRDSDTRYSSQKDSMATEIIKDQVAKSTNVIRENVKNCIAEFDYESQVKDSIAALSDTIANSLYQLSELLQRTK